MQVLILFMSSVMEIPKQQFKNFGGCFQTEEPQTNK
jgi:hypothetical protein